MDEEKTIGSRIASMRGFRQMTQDQLGGMVGVTNTTLSGWEHGYRAPNAQKLILLSKALGCSADYLLGLVDHPGDFYGGSHG